MCVVESDKALVVLTVKRQRVVQTVRTFLSDGHAPDLEFHPVLTFFVEDQNLAVEIEKSVQSLIPTLPMLSQDDNKQGA